MSGQLPLRGVLYLLANLMLIALGLYLMGVTRALAFSERFGQKLWRHLQPLSRRFLPARSIAQAFPLGLLWGWLPCGLSSTMLMAAWFQADTLNGALLMAVFGLGTLPMMVPLTWSGARAMRAMQRGWPRRGAAALLVLSGLITAGSPWLMQVQALHGVLSALGCSVPT